MVLVAEETNLIDPDSRYTLHHNEIKFGDTSKCPVGGYFDINYKICF